MSIKSDLKKLNTYVTNLPGGAPLLVATGGSRGLNNSAPMGSPTIVALLADSLVVALIRNGFLQSYGIGKDIQTETFARGDVIGVTEFEGTRQMNVIEARNSSVMGGAFGPKDLSEHSTVVQTRRGDIQMYFTNSQLGARRSLTLALGDWVA